MPVFDTPGPIAIIVSLVAGDVRITASDRADTVIEVRPANSSVKSERLAEETRVEFADGRLSVRTPKSLGTLFGRPGQITVDIDVPAGSRLDGDTSMGDLVADGDLGECRYKTGCGAIRIGQAARLRLDTGIGDVTVDRGTGDAEITTGTGRVRVGRIDGAAVVKNSNGDTWVGEATGGLRIQAANGDIEVDRAPAGVTAKTARGGLRVAEAVAGSVTLETAAGGVEIGIPGGTAAWLDLDTSYGTVRSSLDSFDGPSSSDRTVEVRARTHVGDIVIQRA
jgi:hypothetical protein